MSRFVLTCYSLDSKLYPTLKFLSRHVFFKLLTFFLVLIFTKTRLVVFFSELPAITRLIWLVGPCGSRSLRMSYLLSVLTGDRIICLMDGNCCKGALSGGVAPGFTRHLYELKASPVGNDRVLSGLEVSCCREILFFFLFFILKCTPVFVKKYFLRTLLFTKN